MAGGGSRGGITYGATDEMGMSVVEQRVDIHDLHATILHQLGLHGRKLEVPDRKRLDADYGEVIRPLLA